MSNEGHSNAPGANVHVEHIGEATAHWRLPAGQTADETNRASDRQRHQILSNCGCRTKQPVRYRKTATSSLSDRLEITERPKAIRC